MDHMVNCSTKLQPCREPRSVPTTLFAASTHRPVTLLPIHDHRVAPCQNYRISSDPRPLTHYSIIQTYHLEVKMVHAKLLPDILSGPPGDYSDILSDTLSGTRIVFLKKHVIFYLFPSKNPPMYSRVLSGSSMSILNCFRRDLCAASLQ